MITVNLILNPELQLVLDDSERIRHALQDFRLVLAEISAVCDISTQEERLDQNDQQVRKMQHNVLEPLEQLLQTAGVRISTPWFLVTPHGSGRKQLDCFLVHPISFVQRFYFRLVESVESFSRWYVVATL